MDVTAKFNPVRGPEQQGPGDTSRTLPTRYPVWPETVLSWNRLTAAGSPAHCGGVRATESPT